MKYRRVFADLIFWLCLILLDAFLTHAFPIEYTIITILILAAFLIYYIKRYLILPFLDGYRAGRQ